MQAQVNDFTFQLVATGRAERIGDFIQKKVGVLAPSPLKRLADGGRCDGAARDVGRQILGHLLRSRLGVPRPVVQDGEERLTGLSLTIAEAGPRPQQHVLPASFSKGGAELIVGLEGLRGGQLLRVQRTGEGTLAILGHQAEQRDLEVVPKTPFARSDAAEVAPHEVQRELLENLVGGIDIAEHFPEIAMDRGGISLKDSFLGCAGRLGA